MSQSEPSAPEELLVLSVESWKLQSSKLHYYKCETSIAERWLAYGIPRYRYETSLVYVFLRHPISPDSGGLHTIRQPAALEYKRRMTSTCQKEGRHRRTLRRSRFGCRNCKLRKLKCDEGKPQCKRCSSFGLVCNFMPDVPDLQSVADDSIRSSFVRGAEPQPPLDSAVWTSDASTRYQLDAKCQDFVTRYLGRSLITPDDPNMVEVNRKLLGLTFAYPFLMHASLAVALAYDRYRNSSSGSRRTLEECYHWSQSTVLFNRRLREPIETKDKDPIWGTAAALAILSFSSPDSCPKEESWPLKPSDPSDWEWLRMVEGKMTLWPIINPLRPDSLFSVMAPTFAQMNSPLPGKGIDSIPRALATVCQLEDSSSAENSPYFNAAHAVAQIQGLSDTQVTTGHTQLFTRSIQGPFKSLLRKKDPVALLLLYLWYRKAGRSIWWIELRARVECPSICSYLRLYHKGYDAIHAFLPGGALADIWNQSDLRGLDFCSVSEILTERATKMRTKVLSSK